jgi:NTE family protein
MPRDEAPKTVGLALGGGGARGLAHIGVLKVLERERVPIECLAGTSMGGLVAALYGSGLYSIAELEQEAEQVGKFKEMIKLVDLGLQQAGLIKGARIYGYMMERLGPDLTFADLGLPIALVAVDMITGQQVILQEGPLIDAIRATISVPGVFVPVERGDYKLVDGGILNNVPADVVRDLGADIVIAVDVMDYYGEGHRGRPSLRGQLPFDFVPQYLEDLWQVQMIMIDALTEFRFQRAKPEVVIRPELPDEITLFVGFHRAEEAIAAGEAAAEDALPQIRGLVAQ